MKPVLLVGIGNTLRQDDGAGAAVVKKFHNHASVEALSVTQLLPEHVEKFHRRSLILFVDAEVNRDKTFCEPLVESIQTLEKSNVTGHLQHPYNLLLLYRVLYQDWPKSFLISLPAVDFGFGERFSDTCQRGVEEAVMLIESMIPSVRPLFQPAI